MARVVNMPFLLLAIGFLCLGGCLLGFNAAANRTRPLTLPDTVKIQALTAADCASVEATQFVSGLEGTGIQVAFQQEPDVNTLGTQEISLVFSLNNEICTASTSLYRYHLEETVTVKLGQEETVDIRDFLQDETLEANFVGQGPSDIAEGSAGVFDLKILCGGLEYPVTYVITEEIAPTGVGKTVTVEAGSVPEPSVFAEKIEDHSQVTVTYKEQPTFITMGTEKVTLVLTDAFGNTSEVEAEAQVVPAANGPQFTGLSDLYVQLGSPVSYRTGVTATDKQDGDLTFTVDPGQYGHQNPRPLHSLLQCGGCGRQSADCTSDRGGGKCYLTGGAPKCAGGVKSNHYARYEPGRENLCSIPLCPMECSLCGQL